MTAPVEPCVTCGGTGMVPVRTGAAYEHFDQGDFDLDACPDCYGSGLADAPAPQQVEDDER